ncbi:MAG: hypothetical protein RMI43_01620 [Candidatus Caldarchaeum sp.]|nr:hypothetical protein [Candidatus Caldarchaeum sp.]
MSKIILMKKTSLLAVAVASAVVGIVINLAINTPSAVWGVSNSPTRQALFYMNAILIYVIPGLVAIAFFSGKPEWLAPPGRYVPEGKYFVSSPYFLSASAIIAAVATVAGLPGPLNIDTVALVTAFAAVYFGPFVAFLGTSVAFILRYALGLTPWVATPNIVVAYALMDGGIWAISAGLFWFVVRGRQWSLPIKNILTIVMAFVFMAVHFSGWVITNYFTNNPYEAALANMAWAISPAGFVISSFVAQFLGTLIGSFYYDSRLAYATAGKAAPKPT